MESPEGTKQFAAAAESPSEHWHYQTVSFTMYPETRKRLAKLHAKRAQLDVETVGWVVGAESRAAEAAASPVKTAAE